VIHPQFLDAYSELSFLGETGHQLPVAVLSDDSGKNVKMDHKQE
jgi:hypothetical protein